MTSIKFASEASSYSKSKKDNKKTPMKVIWLSISNCLITFGCLYLVTWNVTCYLLASVMFPLAHLQFKIPMGWVCWIVKHHKITGVIGQSLVQSNEAVCLSLLPHCFQWKAAAFARHECQCFDKGQWEWGRWSLLTLISTSSVPSFQPVVSVTPKFGFQAMARTKDGAEREPDEKTEVNY